MLLFETPFETNTLASLDAIRTRRVVIISDQNVAAHYLDQAIAYFKSNGISVETIVLRAGEGIKTRETKHQIEDDLFALGCGRDTTLIALGGGVITDLTGFVAATFCRGVPVIYIPTSLLAMVDAAIGGKTGVNTPAGKNLIGTFTAPLAIFISPTFLTTLPEAEYRGAIAEMIKHALIADAKHFEFLESSMEALKQRDENVLHDAIRASIKIKTTVVAEDVNEQGKRALLNFGHTVAHAIERASDYSIAHGVAVAQGLIIEAALSMTHSGLDKTAFERIVTLIEQVGIDLSATQKFSNDTLFTHMQHDKKNKAAAVHCVLLKEIGVVYVVGDQYTHMIDDLGASIFGQSREKNLTRKCSFTIV